MIARPISLATRPSMSVVVPCYNYGRFLPDSVGSALNQEGVDVEVIIVDDASTDGSVSVARALASSDARIRVVAHEQNAGHIATYNDGLTRTTGDYVVLLSADDQLAPGSLARSAALLESRPEVGLVYGEAPTFTGNPPDAPSRAVTFWSVWTGASWLRRVCRSGRNFIVNPEVLMRRSVLEEVGGYDPALPHTADMDLWMRAALVGGVGRINGPAQAYYREHGENMHLTDFGGLLTDMQQRARGFEQFFDGPGRDMEGGAALRRAALRSIAYEALRVARLRGDDGSDAVDRTRLAEFGLACWPPAAHRPPGWAYQIRDVGPGTHVRDVAAAKLHDVRWRVRSQMARRFGT